MTCGIRFCACAGGKSKRGKEVAEGPAWAEQLQPELADVMRSLQQLSGAALASPGMKPFRHLLGSFSPDSLLALGKHTWTLSPCYYKELYGFVSQQGRHAKARGHWAYTQDICSRFYRAWDGLQPILHLKDAGMQHLIP